MNHIMENKQTYWSTGSVWRSLLLLIPMMLIISLMLGSNFMSDDKIRVMAFMSTFTFFGTMFWKMLFTGQTDKWRAVVFITAALLFSISFISNLISLRGTMTFANDDALTCSIPFCHIVTTMIIIPAAVKQTIIFPGSLADGFASISMMLVIVIGFSVVLGRGFCSWGCFYGGWDDATSRLRSKPVIKGVNNAYRWFSFAVLIMMALWSAEAVGPVYCSWLCPFKAVTENEQIVDTVTLLKNICFCTTFIVLVIVLPMLTKKRIQCATFCPMGALLSLFNKINIFEVKNDKSKCIGCGKCDHVCPMLAIDNHCPNMSCSKCGKCVDACPVGALKFHIKCTRIDKYASLARTLYIFPAYTFMVTLLGGSVINGLTVAIKMIMNLF